jgi:hypothetical protein
VDSRALMAENGYGMGAIVGGGLKGVSPRR